MAITAYVGRPGAGKSYAMIAEVIVPAVMDGRRVLTNIEGVKPETIVAHCIAEGGDPDAIGSVVTFDGQDALKPGFFPTESIPDTQTFLKGGDLLVFDEWRLYFDNSKRAANPDLEPFLRWHRHLVGPDGRACDVVIGTQLMTDVHRNYRGLVHRSYKFKKLDAVAAAKSYTYHVFEGHLQPKDGHHAVGHGRYSKAIYALYSSYAGTKSAKEASTDRRGSMFNKSFIVGGLTAACLVGFGLYRAWGVFFSPVEASSFASLQQGSTDAQAALPARVSAPPRSPFRIVGHIIGDSGVQVIVASDAGALRVLPPDGFDFAPDGRPIGGFVDGQTVTVEERIQVNQQERLLGL